MENKFNLNKQISKYSKATGMSIKRIRLENNLTYDEAVEAAKLFSDGQDLEFKESGDNFTAQIVTAGGTHTFFIVPSKLPY